MTDFLKLSKEAYDASVTFFEANHRADLDYSLRAFRNEHAAGSKYLSPEYQHRSRLFRPKTRSIIRKVEAAGAVALFSNMEIVDLQPGNPGDPMSVASRDAIKHVLEYRLQNTIPAFEICMGGIQDAQTQGIVCSYQYWEYNKRKKIDRPCIELRPLENLGLDGSASWIDPVGTSPYFYDIIPMPVCTVRGMMELDDDKTKSKWKKFDDKVIMKARPEDMHALRQSRLGKSQDPDREEKGVSDFDIVWVYRWFMRDAINDDYHYYTLGLEELLTDPVPLEEAYFHGIRPYAMGYAILETHKVLKTSMPVLVKPLQQETNAVANDRLDNVKLVLHKRYYVARGRQVDVQSLVRGAAGAVTLMTDPKTDVVEGQWGDVTSSSYVEQDRLNADFSDLAGEFSPATKFANKASNDTLGGTRLAAQGAGLMTDYMLRTIIETWWEKVLRQLVKLEAAYETDEKVLAICAKKAQLFPRYGLSSITDEMLNDDVTLTVNVGMGATNPDAQFQKLIFGFNAVMDTISKAPPNFNAPEFIKEASSKMGYRDGQRFWSNQADPRLMKAMQMLQQMQGQLQGKQMELQAQGQIEMAKIQSNEKIKGAEIQVNAQRIAGDIRIRETENAIEAAKVNLDKFIADAEAQGNAQELVARMQEMRANLEQAQLGIQEQKIKNEGTALKLIADLRKKEAQPA